ncbi:MAG TPA: hypothetical protein VGL60_07500 [Acidimicrobiales bacterium]|jgi:hypothetical protein
MPRHIEIELTSHAPDGSWTWRAVGARQPRGLLDAETVPGEAKVGDQFRAEVASGIEGIEVVDLLPPKSPRPAAQAEGRIEVLGTTRRTNDISVTLAPGSRRRRDDRPARHDEARGEGAGRGRGVVRRRSEGGEAAERPARGPAPRGGPGARRPGPERVGTGPRERDRRPTVSMAHRNAALAAMRAEQLPIAEAVLRGGIPAVRQSIDEQNAAARSAGRPPMAADAVLKIAEDLLPGLKLAEWKDRATSAQAAGRDLRLRELRAVVAASRTVTLDDEGRALAKALQESLETRASALRDDWLRRMTSALDEGRTLDALRASGRPPEAGTRCPADVAIRLAEAAGAAMTADLPGDQWAALLEAVVDSPVRRTVKPQGIPASGEAASAARNAAGLVPELAKLLGLRIPPPPPRRMTVRRSLSSLSGGGPEDGS